MRILLVNSYCKFKFIPPLYPIALAYVGSSVLRNTKNTVTILDLNLYDDPLNKLKEVLTVESPEIIGISMRDMPWYHSVFSSPIVYIMKLSKMIKTHNPSATVIMGGACFSLFSEDLMELLPDVDIGVVGEGEEAFVETLNNLGNLDVVKGIFYRKKGEIKYTGARPFMDVDKIPMLEDIRGLEPLRYKYVGVQTRRGCASECIYCPNEFLQGRRIRLRPIKSVIEEIRFYKDRGVNYIYFADTIFNVPKNYAIELVAEIIKSELNIKWGAQFKPVALDRVFLQDVERSGCHMLDFTADCGSDDFFRLLKAKVSVKDVLETVELVSERKNITQAWYSITNLPGETVKNNFERIKLFVKLIKKGVKPKDIFLNRLKYCPRTELNNLYPKIRKIDISKPSFYYWYLLLDKDIYMTFLIGLWAIYRAMKGFKRYAY